MAIGLVLFKNSALGKSEGRERKTVTMMGGLIVTNGAYHWKSLCVPKEREKWNNTDFIQMSFG